MSPLIDTHHHVWDPATADYDWMTDDLAAIRRRFDTGDLTAATDPAGVTGTVLVQTRSSFDESREFLALAAETPIILGVVAWVDLTADDVVDRIAELRAGTGGEYLRGIRHQVHDEEDENWLLRDDVRRGLAVLRDNNLVYDLLLRSRELPAAIRVVQEMPDLVWVLDHIAKPEIAVSKWEPWAALIQDLADASPSCWVKLSGMVTEADWSAWTADDLCPYAHHVIKAFGPERCMLGTDWPVCLLAASYQQVIDTGLNLISHLPPEEQMAIRAGNAVKAYSLDPHEVA